MNKPFGDEVTVGVGRIHNFLDYMLRERSQLYGVILHLMNVLNESQVELPSLERLMAYGKDYYILVDTTDNKYVVKVMEREDSDDSEEEILD